MKVAREANHYYPTKIYDKGRRQVRDIDWIAYFQIWDDWRFFETQINYLLKWWKLWNCGKEDS